jgi:DNA-binding NtrC family response regulator
MEDVPALARAFAARLAKGPMEVTSGAMDRLLAHDWPGNVRELRNVVERAVILSKGGVLRAGDIVVGAPGDVASPRPSLDGTLDETMERWRQAGEAARIRLALETAAGDRARAAEELGIPLRRLSQRIKDLGI